jgi:hypothetical protein
VIALVFMPRGDSILGMVGERLPTLILCASQFMPASLRVVFFAVD